MFLRKIEKSDLPTRVAWMNNPKVYSTMHFDVPILLENTVHWFERNLLKTNRVDVTFVDNEQIVAFGGFTSIDTMVGKAETYLFTDPANHHHGIGTRAKLLMCQYGFEELGLNKLYFLANEDNAPIIKLNEKCGFTLEGRLRQEYRTAEGKLKDMLYFGLLKNDWTNKSMSYE